MLRLRLDTGEDAEATAYDGSFLTIHGPRAFAPGSPIRFRTEGEEHPRRFEGRVLGSKRIDEQRFELRLRFVNLPRGNRELLLERLP